MNPSQKVPRSPLPPSNTTEAPSGSTTAPSIETTTGPNLAATDVPNDVSAVVEPSISPSVAPTSPSPSATPSDNPSDAPSKTPVSPEDCSDLVVLDFETAGNGTRLHGGDYVRNEWADAYGVIIDTFPTIGGFAPDNKARIFNTSNPIGDFDLGSPHR